MCCRSTRGGDDQRRDKETRRQAQFLVSLSPCLLVWVVVLLKAQTDVLTGWITAMPKAQKTLFDEQRDETLQRQAPLAARMRPRSLEEFVGQEQIVGEGRRVVKEAQDRVGMFQQRTVVFIDEIHRFNKAQQDAVLPYVEDGTIILIGATTENPSFEVNSA